MTKVLLYSPYLDSLGGGERYMLTVAYLLVKNNIQVDFLWNGDASYINKAEKNFAIDLKQVNFKNLSFTRLNLVQKYLLMKDYDYSFILSDGSIPFLFSKKNYLHAQVPFNFPNQKNLINKIKLTQISSLICNSNFTQKWVQKTYGTSKTQVLYPPISVARYKKHQKNNFQILSVSRFNANLNSKRQDILIKAFSLLYNKDKRYSLVLAGSSPNSNDQIKLLEEKAKGLPIKFVLNPDSKKLSKLYSQSKIFWHAAGYGINQDTNPEMTEHFGMVLVEALSFGCLVFAVDKGGAREIIRNKINGYLYDNLRELVKKTLSYSDKPVKPDVSIDKFSVTTFEKKLIQLFK